MGSEMCIRDSIHIVCIFDTNENTERLYKKVVEDSLNSLTRKEGQFYKGTLRQRQVLETEQSIIILGDVEFGATVVSKGNIVVLGAVRGTVHAGATGDRNAFITALSMRPHVMKIADIVSTHTYLQDETVRPSIARLDGKRIYIDPLENLE